MESVINSENNMSKNTPKECGGEIPHIQRGTLIPERSDVEYFDENGEVLDEMRDRKIFITKLFI